MARKDELATVVLLSPPNTSAVQPPVGPFAARLVAIGGDGALLVDVGDGRQCYCDYLIARASEGLGLSPGDRVLVQPLPGEARPVVMGRIGAYPAMPENAIWESAGTLTLRCGASSIDLRADGKVMIRGEDVLVRAKGTKRIRAGTVSIN
jgi:hypothetical protein